MEMGNPPETGSDRPHGIILPGDRFAVERNYDNDPQKKHRKEVRQNVRAQVRLTLDELDVRYRGLNDGVPERQEGMAALDRITTEKKTHPDKSYFEIIKQELDKYEDIPNARNLAVANVLVNAREIITRSATDEGLFQRTKDLLDEAEKIKDPVEMRRAIETIVKRADNLDEEATGLNSKNADDVPYNDHAGVVKEYLRVAQLNLDLADLVAEGNYYVPGTKNKTEMAKKLERQIDLYGWGFPPLTLVEQAKNRMEKGEIPQQQQKEAARPSEASVSGEVWLANTERLTKENEKEMYDKEKAWLEKEMEKWTREVVANANENKFVIGDYSARRTAEQGLAYMEEYIAQAREQVRDLTQGAEMPERSKVLLDRFEMLHRWMKANYYEVLVNSNYMGNFFYDGEAGLQFSIKAKERLDPQMANFDTGVDLETLFKGLTPEYATELGKTEGREIKVLNEGEWRLGEEIIRKQNEMNRFLRAFSAVHRHKGRNAGQDVTPQLRFGENGKVTDYKINNKITTFVEGVFGAYTEVDRTERVPTSDGGHSEESVRVKVASEKIKTIHSVSNKKEAEVELERFFKEQEMRSDAYKKRSVDIAVGERREIDSAFVRDLSNVRKWSGWSIWIDGAEWKVTPDTIHDLQDELDWRVGSGDKVFIGKADTVDKRNYTRIRGAGSQDVAILKETPPALDNPFTSDHTGNFVKLLARKQSLLISHDPVEVKLLNDSGEVVGTRKMSLWESLDTDSITVTTKGKDGKEEKQTCRVWVDAEALADEFNESLKTHNKVDQIDRHIMDMARLGILGRAEGHEVGWGFEYESKSVGGTRVSMNQRDIQNLRRQFQQNVSLVDSYRIVIDGKENVVGDDSLETAERWARRGQKVTVIRYKSSEVGDTDIARWRDLLTMKQPSAELDACKVMINGKEESLSLDTIKKIEDAKTADRKVSFKYIRHTMVNKRSVVTGNSKACTDSAAPADILRSKANDIKKGWPSGMMPISIRESKWILHHEPGWRPNWNEETKSWGMYYFGVWIPYNVPAKFNLNLWNAAKVAEGKDKGKSLYRLMVEGKKMSELPFSEADKDAMYSKGLIDWGQIATQIKQLKHLPDRDAMEFHGELNYEGPINDYTNAQKKGNLGFRTFGAGDTDVVNMISHLSSMTLAYRLGLLPTSNNIHNRIESWQRDRIIKHTSQSLGNIIASENWGGASERREKFLAQMEQLKKEGDFLRRASRLSTDQGRPLEAFQMQDERRILGLSYVDY